MSNIYHLNVWFGQLGWWWWWESLRWRPKGSCDESGQGETAGGEEKTFQFEGFELVESVGLSRSRAHHYFTLVLTCFLCLPWA